MKLTKLNQLLENGKVVNGRWDLGPNHELRYRAEGLDEEIKLKGSLLAAEPDALVFAVTERQSDQKVTTSVGRLTGAWSLDLKNRIIFLVEKEKSQTDTLTFQGAWEVNKNHEIVYAYEEKDLKKGKKRSQELAFKGDGQMFLRLQRDLGDSRIEAGARFRW